MAVNESGRERVEVVQVHQRRMSSDTQEKGVTGAGSGGENGGLRDAGACVCPDELEGEENGEDGGEAEDRGDVEADVNAERERDDVDEGRSARGIKEKLCAIRSSPHPARNEPESGESVALKRQILALQCLSRGAPLPFKTRQSLSDDSARTRDAGACLTALETYHERRRSELGRLELRSLPHETRVRVAIARRLIALRPMQRRMRLAMRAEKASMEIAGGEGDPTQRLIDWRRFGVGGVKMEAGEARFTRAMRVVRKRIDAANEGVAKAKGQMQANGSGSAAAAGGAGPSKLSAEDAAKVAAKAAAQKKLMEERRAAIAAAKAAQEKRQLEMRKQFEQRLRKERERKLLKERLKRFHNSIFDALKDMRAKERAKRSVRRLRNDFVLRWHEKEERRLRRNEEMRIKALKNSDHEAYSRMVQESKNERLRMLMSKTNDIVAQLGEKLSKSRKEAEEEEEEEVEEEDEEEDGEQKQQQQQQQQQQEGDDVEHGKAGEAGGDTRRVRTKARSGAAVDDVREQPAMLVGAELRPYQLAGLKWMAGLHANKMNGILADEMGLGKTIQTISLIAYLMEKRNVYGPHLILAPKATLSNWHNEIERFCPDIDVVHYDGKPEDRRAMREGPIREGTFNVLLTHYDLAMSDKFALKKIAWNYLVVDEGHRMKNHKSKLADVLQREYSFRYRLLLTGTPIQNNLTELWALLNFILPHIFNSQQNFSEWFNAPFAGDKEDVVLNEEEQHLIILRLHSVMRPFLLRRTKKEVELDLPDKRSGIIKCGLSAWQKLYYTNVVENKRIGSHSLNNRVMQLRKVCNHPYLFGGGVASLYDDDDDGDMNGEAGSRRGAASVASEEQELVRRLEEITRACGKLALLASVLRKLHRTNHRVLVFSTQTKALDVIQDFLELAGYAYLRLDGTNKGDERSEMISKFNAPESDISVFLLSTRAGGLGINLQTADTVIIYDSDWNPQADAQAEARAHRIGQKNEVRVLVLVSAGTIEERILERAQEKRQIDEQVIQAGMFNSNWTEEDRTKVLDEALQRKVLAGLGGGVTSNAEVNRMVARNDEELELFDAMDEELEDDPSRLRLMTEHEIPAYVIQEELNMKNAAQKREKEMRRHEEEGRHARSARKKRVVYADVFTDDQFCRLVEKGADLQEEQERLERKGKRRAASSSRQRRSGRDANADDAENRPSKKKPRRQAAQKALEVNAKLAVDELDDGGGGDDHDAMPDVPESSVEL